MQANNFSLSDYLKRIGCTAAPGADLAGLTSLMQQQLFTVPFENLDVQAGKLVSMVPEDIVEKIVYQGRGGYCYEVNGLFSMALEAMGLSYHWVAARPMFYPTRRPRTHMAVVVDLPGGPWLCDLGFGSYGIRAPLSLAALDTEIDQGHDRFQLSRQPDGDYLLQALVNGVWVNQYAFDLTPQEWVDFEPMNYLNSTHPEAVFVKSLLVIGHHPRGRNILFGQSLKMVEDGQTQQREIALHEIDKVLKDLFHLPPVLHTIANALRS